MTIHSLIEMSTKRTYKASQRLVWAPPPNEFIRTFKCSDKTFEIKERMKGEVPEDLSRKVFLNIFHPVSKYEKILSGCVRR